jgi:hypothetical protein
LSEDGVSRSNIEQEIQNAMEKDPGGPAVSAEEVALLTAANVSVIQPKSLRVLASEVSLRCGLQAPTGNLLCTDAFDCLASSGDGVLAQDDWRSASEDEDEAEDAPDPVTEAIVDDVVSVVAPAPTFRRKRRRRIQNDSQTTRTTKGFGRMERIKSSFDSDNPRCLSCLIFVDRKWTARILFNLLRDLSHNHPDFWFVIERYLDSNSSFML